MISLHVFPPSPRAIKVVALKNFLKIEVEVRALDYFKADHLQPEFAKLNPNRRMPVLEEDGWVLWESNAILLFLAAQKPDYGLWPTSVREQAEVMRWLSWESSHWDPAWDILITEHLKKRALVTRESGRRTEGATNDPQAADPARIAEGLRAIHELAGILDEQLADQSWVAGENLTIADFALAPWISVGSMLGAPLDGFDAVQRWYGTVVALPGWEQALPHRPAS
jgi:glutathione S-transferase